MNIDRTAWKAEKRTSGQYDKTFPQLQVVGSRIYYVRQQPDGKKSRERIVLVINNFPNFKQSVTKFTVPGTNPMENTVRSGRLR